MDHNITFPSRQSKQGLAKDSDWPRTEGKLPLQSREGWKRMEENGREGERAHASLIQVEKEEEAEEKAKKKKK